MVLPSFLKTYFWDVDFQKLDFEKYPNFVIERILEYGNQRSVSWLSQFFSRDIIKETVINSRTLSPKSANFWALILGLDRKKVLCLKKLSTQRRNKFWLNSGKIQNSRISI